jgi:hypothetical protein
MSVTNIDEHEFNLLQSAAEVSPQALSAETVLLGLVVAPEQAATTIAADAPTMRLRIR